MISTLDQFRFIFSELFNQKQFNPDLSDKLSQKLGQFKNQNNKINDSNNFYKN